MNKKQKIILDNLKQYDGLMVNDLARITKIHHKTLRYNLGQLQSQGKVGIIRTVDVRGQKAFVWGLLDHGEVKSLSSQVPVTEEKVAEVFGLSAPEVHKSLCKPIDHCPPKKIEPQLTLAGCIEKAIKVLEQALELAVEKDKQNADVAAGLQLITEALKKG